MARPESKAPARSYHLSGQSVVRIDNTDWYLGKHDSPESIARYAVLIGIYQANGLRLPDGFAVGQLDEQAARLLGQFVPVTDQTKLPILVRHVTALYRPHVAGKYKHSIQDRQRCERLCDLLDEKFGGVAAADFGPLKLGELRDVLILQGLRKITAKPLSRGYVNRLVRCVIAIFTHAVSKELVPVEKIQQLKTLEPLRYGHAATKENPKVQPANLVHVRATAKYLSPVVKAMLRVQVSTGMRPKELFSMRPMDIDRTGKVWLYAPASHKTISHGKERTIPLVGDAREAILDYLARDPQSYLFSPAEAVAWMRAVATANRKTPAGYGNRPGTNRVQNPQRSPADQYSAQSYRQAINRAAKKAGVPHWFPYRLRHLTATMVLAALKIGDAQALLGHSSVLTTYRYAQESIEAATRAASSMPKL